MTQELWQVLPSVKGPLPSIISFPPAETEGELFLLRSIEWTTFLETTYDTALEQANVILRYFLGML
jgi:nuclear pore complex protein Nup107